MIRSGLIKEGLEAVTPGVQAFSRSLHHRSGTVRGMIGILVHSTMWQAMWQAMWYGNGYIAPRTLEIRGLVMTTGGDVLPRRGGGGFAFID